MFAFEAGGVLPESRHVGRRRLEFGAIFPFPRSKGDRIALLACLGEAFTRLIVRRERHHSTSDVVNEAAGAETLL